MNASPMYEHEGGLSQLNRVRLMRPGCAPLDAAVVSASVGSLTLEVPASSLRSTRVGEQVEIFLQVLGRSVPVAVCAQLVDARIDRGKGRIVCAFEAEDMREAWLASASFRIFNRRAAYRVKPKVGDTIPMWMDFGSGQVEGWLFDLSLDGLRACSRFLDAKQLELHDQVQMRLKLPESRITVEVAGEVVRVDRVTRVTQCGIRFDSARVNGSGNVDQRIVDYVMQRQREMLQQLWEKSRAG